MRVVVLSTGGTIASRATGDAKTATDSAADLLARAGAPSGTRIEGCDVFRVGSFRMTLDHQQQLLQAVLGALAEPDVVGVVVTHGTDTMEESAFLVDLFLDDVRPVVFTGAQRSADAPDSDGPANLRDALTVATSSAARGLGSLIVFEGAVLPARGTRKTHTLASGAFAAPDRGPLGAVVDGRLRVHAEPRRGKPLDPARLDLPGVRVDIVPVYPGVDTVALDAVVAAGARAVVLEATGAGNANPTLRDAVAELSARGVVVALSTRVHAGPVVPIYGDGGGRDLLAAGALPTGTLRPGQVRVLLLALLGTGASTETVRSVLADLD